MKNDNPTYLSRLLLKLERLFNLLIKTSSKKSQETVLRTLYPQLVIPFKHILQICSVRISANGRYVLSGSEDGSIKLWDLTTRKQIRSILGHQFGVTSVCFSSDDRKILSGGRDMLIKLWDVYTGEIIQTFKGHKAEVNSVFFSPDGNYVLSGSKDKTLKVWDIKEGIEYFTLQGCMDSVNSCCFSSNGRYILSGNENSIISLWDNMDGKVSTFNGHKAAVTSVCFSPDDRLILSGSKDNTIKLWDRKDKKEVFSFDGNIGNISNVSYSSDGKLVLAGGENQLFIWDLENHEVLVSQTEKSGCVNSVCFSQNGDLILAGGRAGKIMILDRNKLNCNGFLEGYSNPLTSACLSPDNHYALSGNMIGLIQIWDIKAGCPLDFFFTSNVKVMINCVCFSPDGSQVLSGSDDGEINQFDFKTRKIIISIQGHKEGVTSVCLSKDGRHALTGDKKGIIKYWDIKKGILIKSIKSSEYPIKSLCFSLEDKTAIIWNNQLVNWDLESDQILVSSDMYNDFPFTEITSTIRSSFSSDLKYVLLSFLAEFNLLDTSLKKTIYSFNGHSSYITALGISEDKKFALSGSLDSSMRLWDIQTGKEIAALIILDSKSWVITTPSGLFDASEGALSKIHYTIGLEIIGFDQLVGMYRIPGLLPILLSDSKEKLPEVPPIANILLHPSMEAGIENDNLIIALENRGGGIGRVMVYVENIEFIEDARKEPVKDQSQERLTIRIDLMAYQKFFIPARPNRLTVFSENENGTVRSKPIHLEYSPDFLVSKGGRQSEITTQPLVREADRPLKMHAVFIGSNTQGSSKKKLQYAARDANEMASVAKAAAKKLYGEENMVISVFSGENLSKKEILEEFSRMQELTAEDVVMIFLSGHGTTNGEFKEYYYLLRDWDQTVSIETMIATPYMRDICTLSIRELKKLVNSIPAQKRILILDTCQSGSISGHFSGAKSIDLGSYSQKKVISEVRRSTGFCVLSGCAGDKESFEYEAYKHGLMTYSILLGISTGEGLLEKEGKQYIEPLKLFNYVKEKTENLANSLNHTQKPEILIPESMAGDLFLGEVTQEQKQAIKLTELKMFTWSSINPIKPKDELELSKKMNQFLDRCASRGELVYIEREDSPDVYQIVGNYLIEDEQLIITCWLKKGGVFLEDSEKEVKFKATELDRVIFEIYGVLRP